MTSGQQNREVTVNKNSRRPEPQGRLGGRGFHSEIPSLFLFPQTAKSHFFHLLKMPGSSLLGNKRECSQGREAPLAESALLSAAGASEVRLGSGEKAG